MKLWVAKFINELERINDFYKDVFSEKVGDFVKLQAHMIAKKSEGETVDMQDWDDELCRFNL